MPFDPTTAGFRRIDFELQDVRHFEYAAPYLPIFDKDWTRLNGYLSQDVDFVTIWFGLLFSPLAEAELGLEENASFPLHEWYHEPLFQGYVTSQSFGEQVIASTRVTHRQAQRLTLSDDGKLMCSLIDVSEID